MYNNPYMQQMAHNVGQGIQQMVNPYMQQMNQYQNMMQNQQNILPGRIVDSFDAVTANDVPMDGRFSTFVKSDMSEIELRQWNGNGTIGSIKYKPIIEDVKTTNKTELEEIKEFLDGFEKRFDALEKMIDKMQKPSGRIRKEE